MNTAFEADGTLRDAIGDTVVLEERIEEVTSTTYSDLDDENTAERTDQHSLRVPFPELGLDLVDADIYSLELEQYLDDKSVRISDLLSWEENWLFQKKKKADHEVVAEFCYTALEAANSPNRMFIPNPSHFQGVKVGLKDIEELSDLSERNSVGSLNFSDDETELDSSDEIVDNQTHFDLNEPETTEKNASTKNAICVEVVPKCVPIPQFVPSQQRLGESVEDPCFIFPPGNASVQIGILIQFCCRVKGSSPLGVSWFKEDIRLTDDDEYRLIDSVNDHILEIKCTKAHHAGSYSCVVFNHLNQKWSDFTLEIKSYNAWQREKTHKYDVEDNFANESEEIRPPPLPDDIVGTFIPPTANYAEREHKKWEECAIEWPNNPYTKENIERRKKLRTVSLDSLLENCSLTDDCELMSNLSPSKDLSRYKRDYFVQSMGKEEALNSFEEKVHSLTARNLNKFQNENKRPYRNNNANSISRSKSLMSIDKSRESSPNSSDTCSPTNEG
ncbi:hypothetical protein B4U79_17357 [Dinothrombium tinctorium]|uniref:Ig-like domain-containing protein n=1 Tax=Dinothrombium tinctorium TaxID=1965070 RepID=A0A3S3P0M2_9ACAR|nr:hypothetical protein B4U79_17408 [Dinothrombium tinctorium]RWS13496.1 hypothetical protein B4U79_17358 [Dinothrombium tinctorium]RWS13498.1 hypothetical protein B4U79_17357 [Dinothrombium tinctorium]